MLLRGYAKIDINFASSGAFYQPYNGLKIGILKGVFEK